MRRLYDRNQVGFSREDGGVDDVHHLRRTRADSAILRSYRRALHVSGGVFVPLLTHHLRLFGFGTVAQHRLDVGKIRYVLGDGSQAWRSGKRRTD